MLRSTEAQVLPLFDPPLGDIRRVLSRGDLGRCAGRRSVLVIQPASQSRVSGAHALERSVAVRELVADRGHERVMH
jgi:hypothetical protein